MDDHLDDYRLDNYHLDDAVALIGMRRPSAAVSRTCGRAASAFPTSRLGRLRRYVTRIAVDAAGPALGLPGQLNAAHPRRGSDHRLDRDLIAVAGQRRQQDRSAP